MLFVIDDRGVMTFVASRKGEYSPLACMSPVALSSLMIPIMKTSKSTTTDCSKNKVKQIWGVGGQTKIHNDKKTC